MVMQACIIFLVFQLGNPKILQDLLLQGSLLTASNFELFRLPFPDLTFPFSSSWWWGLFTGMAHNLDRPPSSGRAHSASVSTAQPWSHGNTAHCKQNARQLSAIFLQKMRVILTWKMDSEYCKLAYFLSYLRRREFQKWPTNINWTGRGWHIWLPGDKKMKPALALFHLRGLNHFQWSEIERINNCSSSSVLPSLPNENYVYSMSFIVCESHD